MSGASEPAPRLRQDQKRALEAYKWAEQADAERLLDDYETAVQGFAATLLRSGLAAAVATLERNVKDKRDGGRKLLTDLAQYHQSTLDLWPGEVRRMDVAAYMLATRELLALLAWLRRACRAVNPKPEAPHAPDA